MIGLFAYTEKSKAPPIVYVVETEYWLVNEAPPTDNLCSARNLRLHDALLTSIRVGVRSGTGYEVGALLKLGSGRDCDHWGTACPIGSWRLWPWSWGR